MNIHEIPSERLTDLNNPVLYAYKMKAVHI